MHYAHSLPGKPPEDWHKLDQHLTDTALLADEFCRDFAPGWGYLAGLWYDLGKYQAAFQRRIGADPNAHTDERVDHSQRRCTADQGKEAASFEFRNSRSSWWPVCTGNILPRRFPNILKC
jgi:hypothetical protein